MSWVWATLAGTTVLVGVPAVLPRERNQELTWFVIGAAFAGFLAEAETGVSGRVVFAAGTAAGVVVAARDTVGGRLDAPARWLTRLAVLIGGRRRAWRAEEFLAHLTAAPSGWTLLRHALGLVRASVVMRARDLAQPLLRCVDWALVKPRTELFTAVVTATAAIYFQTAGGSAHLMSNLENVLSAGALFYWAARWLRGQRGA